MVTPEVRVDRTADGMSIIVIGVRRKQRRIRRIHRCVCADIPRTTGAGFRRIFEIWEKVEFRNMTDDAVATGMNTRPAAPVVSPGIIRANCNRSAERSRPDATKLLI